MFIALSRTNSCAPQECRLPPSSRADIVFNRNFKSNVTRPYALLRSAHRSKAFQTTKIAQLFSEARLL